MAHHRGLMNNLADSIGRERGSDDEKDSRNGNEYREHSMMLSKKNPTYLLEHLATFTVNMESGIMYPADGMRRLLQLEKTTGIWSQKMQLCLDDEWVLIIDYETGNIIERFPTTLIKEPTAFTSDDAMELYNNILIFIVASENNSRSEMHIFQSQSVSAVDLVEAFKSVGRSKAENVHPMMMSKMGRDSDRFAKENYHRSYLKQNEDYKVHESVNDFRVVDESDSETGVNIDENSSTSSDIYERDVSVLNHCFDDIEKFIARLQHAAAASRELERRRRNRKSKKKDPGEGLLSMRTRPPQEKEFIDIFSKFKLSFNLLAKLKAHIHDPNAPELVHFLFTPLALIVEAASDTYYESQLPSQVIKPLLTREAINLLINCVTSKETELWRSLGDAWTVARDQWKESVDDYHPVFLDGWSPDFVIIDEPKHESSKKSSLRAQSSRNLALKGVGNIDVRQMEKYKAGLEDSLMSDMAFDSIERAPYEPSNEKNMNDFENINTGMHHLNMRDEGHEPSRNIQKIPHDMPSKSMMGEQSVAAWVAELQFAGAKVVQVTYPRTANNDKELTVVRGEFLEILDDSRKWWKAKNIHGQIAHVPHTIVASFNDQELVDQYLSHQKINSSNEKTRDGMRSKYT